MRVGVFLLAARFPGQGDEEVLTATVAAAVAAERAGFDDVWLAEHHLCPTGFVKAWTCCSPRCPAARWARQASSSGSARSPWSPVRGPELAGYVPVDGRPRQVRDPDGYAEFLCRIHPVGTASDCAAVMAETARRTGITHLLCMVEGSGDPAALQENIARLGAEVLPLRPGGTAARQ